MTFLEIETKIKDTFNSNKLLFCLLLIPILILKYRSVIIYLLVKDSRKIVDDTTKKDATLAQQQTTAETKADQIIADADKAKKDSESQPVSEDWNAKK